MVLWEKLLEDGFYYHFTHCPIADFCRKYRYEKSSPVFCNIDCIILGLMHAGLIREHTVAEGTGICDYWTVGNKVKKTK
ncbi:MAG: L-2-amino-thiazoline-4-carboxylic acid hydrolase [Oscillospiraceae bacterium]|nr:L-2-amino-thiazoline-4-carboxylic acid hydrolase [Oscillospiraceae bacterium]